MCGAPVHGTCATNQNMPLMSGVVRNLTPTLLDSTDQGLFSQLGVEILPYLRTDTEGDWAYEGWVIQQLI